MIILKTVLRSGGEYKPEHVLRMQGMLDRYVDCPARLVCYSDVDIPGIQVRPLLHDWPGWWAKLELFREAEDSFYIDLDMTITGNITDMVMADSDFMALRNMTSRIEGIGSAMMKWRGDYTAIYETFKADPEKYMAENNKIGTNSHGDQSFVWKVLGGRTEFFQERFPNRISGFKSPQKTDIKVFYGKKKPWLQK